MPREHGEGGRFTQTVTPEDVLAVFDEVRGPVIGSSDVVREVDCSASTARRKLEDLAEDDRIAGREIAGRTIWWRITADEGE